MVKVLKVSVILTVYNEAECIEKTLETILTFSYNKPYYHFIFLNDGSTDKTKQILETNLESAQTSKVKIISYKNNKGKGYAVKTGVEYAEGDYICFIDSDLAYSLEHLENIFEKLDNFDVVIGCRNLIPKSVNQVNLIRKVAGKVFNVVSRKILNLPCIDMQAGIKGFRKDVAKELFKKQGITGFSFDVELIYLAKKKGYTIGQIPARVSDKHLSKASKVNLFIDSIQMLIDLLKINFNDRTGRYE